MGGLGSGRIARGDTLTNDGLTVLDITVFRRRGYLSKHWRGNVRWAYGGHTVFSAYGAINGDALILDYTVRTLTGSEPRRQVIDLDYQDCHFGGRRTYFLCPVITNGEMCNRRAIKLYFRGSRFACRKCSDFYYRSQLTGKFARAADRANKIRARLGAKPPYIQAVPPRPKGMHHMTYHRLVQQLMSYDQLSFEYNPVRGWIKSVTDEENAPFDLLEK